MSSILEKMFGGGDAAPVRSEAATSGVEGSEGTPDLEALRRKAAKSGRRAAKPSSSDEKLQDAQTAAALDELFENENWEEISSMYFDIRCGLTGFDGFLLSEKQKRILGKSMGTCMRLLLAIDPKYVACIIFTLNFGAFVSEKEMKYKWYQASLAAERGAHNGPRT